MIMHGLANPELKFRIVSIAGEKVLLVSKFFNSSVLIHYIADSELLDPLYIRVLQQRYET
jgi:hypothetical protein